MSSKKAKRAAALAQREELLAKQKESGLAAQRYSQQREMDHIIDQLNNGDEINEKRLSFLKKSLGGYRAKDLAEARKASSEFSLLSLRQVLEMRETRRHFAQGVFPTEKMSKGLKAIIGHDPDAWFEKDGMETQN